MVDPQSVERFPQFAGAIVTPEIYHGTLTLDAYRNLAVQIGMQTSRFISLTPTDETLPAYIKHGRWIVQCVCGNCPIPHPDWKVAVCMDCGREWAAIFPGNRVEIEACLKARLVVNRNWNWHETLPDLIRENVEHGLLPRVEG